MSYGDSSQYRRSKTPPPGKNTAEKTMVKYDQIKGQRSNFDSYWQILHDYFYVESMDINRTYYPGTELEFSYLWDSTTLEASDILASGFMNYLTPPTTKWFGLRTPNPAKMENRAVMNWLKDAEAEVFHALSRSNFYNQIFDAYKSSGVYGTSVLYAEDDVDDDIRFMSIPLRQCCIAEDARGRVVEYYFEFEYTAFQAASRFGKEKLSQEMQKDVETNRNPDNKHKFILFIGKRTVRDVNKTDKDNMPYEALWIDVKAKKIIDEGGYEELPAMTHRFSKRPFIAWGFSPGMKALPDARLLNTIAKTNLRAMMKRTDPPIAVPDNAFIMPFNANPRAINAYNKQKMDSSKDIFAFANYGDPNTGMTALEYSRQRVKSLMYNDVFLAFEGLTKQMTVPEVMERVSEKMSLLAPSVGRFLSDVLDPIIIRTLGVLFRKGKLPEPPDELRENPTYEIEYVSQLAQAQKRTEMTSLNNALSLTANIAQYAPEILDGIDPDKTRSEVWAITGASIGVLRDDAEIKKIREQRGQAQAKAQEQEIIERGAITAKDGSQAVKNLAEASK